MNASQRAAQETEEEAIKQAGRQMREAMQKAHLDAQAAVKPTAVTPAATSEPTAAPSSSTRPAMTAPELTLTLQFPAESTGIDFLGSSATLEPVFTARYGPVNFFILKDPPSAASAAGKRKKPRGPKAIVEFKESNWQGCWACWRDHVAKPARPLVEGTKVKWATPEGAVPPWIAWAETHRPSGFNTPPPPSPPPPTAPKISSAFASSFASSFPTPDERRQRDAQSAKADAARTAAEEYESATLFKMRQMERERLEAEIRRQEEEET